MLPPGCVFCLNNIDVVILETYPPDIITAHISNKSQYFLSCFHFRTFLSPVWYFVILCYQFSPEYMESKVPLSFHSFKRSVYILKMRISSRSSSESKIRIGEPKNIRQNVFWEIFWQRPSGAWPSRLLSPLHHFPRFVTVQREKNCIMASYKFLHGPVEQLFFPFLLFIPSFYETSQDNRLEINHLNEKAAVFRLSCIHPAFLLSVYLQSSWPRMRDALTIN